MKTRHGFVSNSSSSSFTCEVCGYEASGMDVSYSDFDMVRCKNGHIFCSDHILPLKEEDKTKTLEQTLKYLIDEGCDDLDYIVEAIKDGTCITEYENTIEEYYSDYEGDYRGVQEEQCPICMLDSIPDDTLIEFIEYKYKIDRKTCRQEIGDTFPNLKVLLETLRPNKE